MGLLGHRCTGVAFEGFCAIFESFCTIWAWPRPSFRCTAVAFGGPSEPYACKPYSQLFSRTTDCRVCRLAQAFLSLHGRRSVLAILCVRSCLPILAWPRNVTYGPSFRSLWAGVERACALQGYIWAFALHANPTVNQLFGLAGPTQINAGSL